jgi:hypothetical protein
MSLILTLTAAASRALSRSKPARASMSGGIISLPFSGAGNGYPSLEGGRSISVRRFLLLRRKFLSFQIGNPLHPEQSR